MRFKLISCEVFQREMYAAAARSPHMVDIGFLPKGLHDLGANPMQTRLQAAVDDVEDIYDAILMGYGLCNNGLAGLTARHCPIILPRAHDCMTLFLGSKERYADYFNNNPGTYFKTTGWIERGALSGELSQLSIQQRSGMNAEYDDLVKKYGEENAKYLYETLCVQTRNYGQFAFIEMGIEPNDSWEQQTREEAQERGWRFDKVRGDMGLIQRLVDGVWDDREVLTVPPGYRVITSFDEQIVTVEEAL